jgi:hypothetical protein
MYMCVYIHIHIHVYIYTCALSHMIMHFTDMHNTCADMHNTCLTCTTRVLSHSTVDCAITHIHTCKYRCMHTYKRCIHNLAYSLTHMHTYIYACAVHITLHTRQHICAISHESSHMPSSTDLKSPYIYTYWAHIHITHIHYFAGRQTFVAMYRHKDTASSAYILHEQSRLTQRSGSDCA